MNKPKFLADAFQWATTEGGMDINSPEFVKDLFQIIAPMSNFEIGEEDIVKFKEANK